MYSVKEKTQLSKSKANTVQYIQFSAKTTQEELLANGIKK